MPVIPPPTSTTIVLPFTALGRKVKTTIQCHDREKENSTVGDNREEKTQTLPSFSSRSFSDLMHACSFFSPRK